MKLTSWFLLLSTSVVCSLLLGTGLSVQSQSLSPGVEETFVPADGSINDLDGLQERQTQDWFPQNRPQWEEEALEVNDETYRPTVNDPDIIRREESEWRNRGSGDPKQTGSGIPLGEF